MDQTNKPEEAKKPGLGSKIREKLKQYKRVLSVARKPDRQEFLLSAKITGAGIIFLGLIGFIIFLIYYLITVPGA